MSKCETRRCQRTDLVPVPGMTCCSIAHVNPHGEPCLDGEDESLAGDDCTQWAVRFAARSENTDGCPPDEAMDDGEARSSSRLRRKRSSRIRVWQERNFMELDL